MKRGRIKNELQIEDTQTNNCRYSYNNINSEGITKL